MRKKIKVDEYLDGQKIDLAWVRADIGVSRKKIRQAIDQGNCMINGKRVRMASRRVHLGDTLIIEIVDQRQKDSLYKAPEIIYENEGCIVVNKEPGLLAQAADRGPRPHLIKLLRQYGRDEECFLELCHRLDKETSGALIVGKDRDSTDHILQLFREKQVKKTYYAIAFGAPFSETWEVKNYLSAINKRTGLVEVVSKGGKFSHTEFECLSVSPDNRFSLIKCEPITGRSHQIRVHLQESGHSIVGDKKYGVPSLKKSESQLRDLASSHHFLHSKKIEFVDKEGNSVLAEAGMPPNFLQFLQKAGLSANR